MSETPQNSRYSALRRDFPRFVFENYSILYQRDTLTLEFHFILAEGIDFHPRHTIHLAGTSIDHLTPEALNSLAFSIGMVELISYWKAACPPNVLIKPFSLTMEQQKWWKKLYYYGLGEYFYLNNIHATMDDFMSFSFDENAQPMSKAFHLDMTDRVIVPVGGGKDSVVTLEILKNAGVEMTALVINQREATRNCVHTAGLASHTISIDRTIDQKLLELNKQEFLNGHTPFSSLLAFVSALVAAITKNRHIALSNEASANEATIPGTTINHQYSKSFEFEQDFRHYLHTYITPDINYFSLLRPLNELQIAGLFAQNKQYFDVFRSCNVGSKTDTWCCHCPKCMFTYIMLAPFVDQEKLNKIFGENLWEKENMILYMEQLAGVASEKPFECVGTIEEVNAALGRILIKKGDEKLPVVLNHYKKLKTTIAGFDQQIDYWNPEHALSPVFETHVKNAVISLKSQPC
jgi:UDP-N-acetyl-alpha-D-muramoyl-L-alanyl-L-glutamate epimerase